MKRNRRIALIAVTAILIEAGVIAEIQTREETRKVYVLKNHVDIETGRTWNDIVNSDPNPNFLYDIRSMDELENGITVIEVVHVGPGIVGQTINSIVKK